MKAKMSGGLSESELQRLDDSEEVAFVIAPLDKMSKTADKAQAQDAVPMMYSRIIFQPIINATNSPTVVFFF